MGQQFRQLTSADRIAICHLLITGLSKDKIAKQLGFHRSSIYRELARNSVNIGYLPIIAERKIQERRHRSFKLNHNKRLRDYIFEKLKLSWSPEQIAGRLKLENSGKSLICHETIYAYLYHDYGIRNKYYRYLRRKREWRYPKISRNRRIKIPNRIPIGQRPIEINQRKTIGHWEGDLMLFGKSTQTNLITLRERYSRYMIAVKNPNRQAEGTAAKIIDKLNGLLKNQVKSITFDNGVEFSRHEKIAEKLKTKIYFCEPYKSYQKGTIENCNKQLREWLPKDALINVISQYEINARIKLLNQRPMKCLAYWTPNEIFFAKLQTNKNDLLMTIWRSRYAS